MTYRGIYRDGVVVLSGEVELPEGAVVEVHQTKRVVLPGRTKKPTKNKRNAVASPSLPGFGAWKARKDIGDTAAFARALRKKVSTRKPKR